jgi:hypothetical protein
MNVVAGSMTALLRHCVLSSRCRRRKSFTNFTMEAGWEWVVRLDALQAIEFRVFDEPGMQYRIDVAVALAKRNSRLEATADAVGFR